MTKQNKVNTITVDNFDVTQTYENVYNMRVAGTTLLFTYINDYYETTVNINLTKIRSFSVSEISKGD